MNRAYRIALICGAIPLVVGIAIFLLWLITRWEWLMVAGVFTLYGGFAVFLIGAVALVRYCWIAFRSAEMPRRRLWRSTIGCATLLVSNFAVAGGIIAAVVTITTIEARYTVSIHNNSSQPLTGVRVFGGGCEIAFGAIPPGGTAAKSFQIERDGSLELSAVSGGTTHSKTIDSYVTHGMNRNTSVTFSGDGTITVGHLSDSQK